MLNIKSVVIIVILCANVDCKLFDTTLITITAIYIINSVGNIDTDISFLLLEILCVNIVEINGTIISKNKNSIIIIIEGRILKMYKLRI